MDHDSVSETNDVVFARTQSSTHSVTTLSIPDSEKRTQQALRYIYLQPDLPKLRLTETSQPELTIPDIPMAPRSFPHRPRQASADPDQGYYNNPAARSSRYNGLYGSRNINDYGSAPNHTSMGMMNQLQTPLQPMGSMPTWYPASQSYHPALTHMQHFNRTPWMGQNYGANSTFAMQHANFENPPNHYYQLPFEPRPDFSQLMMQPPQRNNTPEPATTNNNQQLPVHPSQVPPQVPSTSHPGPATLQATQQPQIPSTSHPGLYMNGQATQQSTNQQPSPNHQLQQEAGPSTQRGQPVVQTAQYEPVYSIPPLNQQPEQEAHLSVQPGQAVAQTPQYAPQNYLIPLPAPPYSYALPNNNNNGAVSQPTRPTGGYRNHDAPQQSQMNWSGRWRSL